MFQFYGILAYSAREKSAKINAAWKISNLVRNWENLELALYIWLIYVNLIFVNLEKWSLSFIIGCNPFSIFDWSHFTFRALSDLVISVLN